MSMWGSTNRRWFGITFLLGILSLAILSASDSVSGSVSQNQSPTFAPTSSSTSESTETATPNFAATATQIASSPHLSIISSDGRVTLLIPMNALPPNVDASAIKITRLQSFKGVLTPEGQPPLLAYQMEPDGLHFNKSALIRIVMEKPGDGRMPVLDTVSGQQIETLNPTRVEFDATNAKITLIAPITHFSYVIVGGGHFVVELVVSGNAYKVVGDTFSAVATVKLVPISVEPPPPTQNAVSPSTRAANVALPPPVEDIWGLAGTWLASSGVAPPVVLDAPTFTETRTPSLEDQRSFGCIAVGDSESVTYLADLTSNEIYYPSPGKERILQRQQTLVVTSKPFSCNYLVTKFTAQFVQAEFSTHYGVAAFDPDGQPLTYEWSNTNSCGSFIWNKDSPLAIWSHPDSNLPGACPVEETHPGTITVVARSKLGAMQKVAYVYGSSTGVIVPKGSK